MFIGLAIVTDVYFVAALEQICKRLDLSEDVAGATFMAAGSSTPEFFASLLAVFLTEDEVGIGTIVGSAVFNILVIIGLSAALAGAVLQLDWRPLVRDSFFYIVSIILLLLFVLPVTKGEIHWWEGLILIVTYCIYVLFMAFGNKRYMQWAGNLKFAKRSQSDADVEAGQCESSQGDNRENWSDSWSNTLTPGTSQGTRDYSKFSPRLKFRAAQLAVIAANRIALSTSSDRSGEDDSGCAATKCVRSEDRTIFGIELPSSILGWIFFPVTFTWTFLFKLTIVDCTDDKKPHLWLLTFLTSIVWISGISYVMVEAARIAGCLIGIPSAAMGLTVLAAGTSVPDALASISVAKSGAGNMAVSNAIGSNVFDILLGLGFPWFLGHLIKGETTKVTVEPLTTVIVPIMILFAIIVAVLVLFFLVRWKLRPLLGYILFTLYGVFIVYTLVDVFVISKDR